VTWLESCVSQISTSNLKQTWSHWRKPSVKSRVIAWDLTQGLHQWLEVCLRFDSYIDLWLGPNDSRLAWDSTAASCVHFYSAVLNRCRRYKKYRLRCSRCWHIPRKQWLMSPASAWRQQTPTRCQKCGLHQSQQQQHMHSKHQVWWACIVITARYFAVIRAIPMTHIPEIGAENPSQKNGTINRLENRECPIRYWKLVPENFGTKLHVRRVGNWYRFSGIGFRRRFLVSVSRASY